MKVTQLIKDLENLRNEHFCIMKNIVPMGTVPDEPEVYMDLWASAEDDFGLYLGESPHLKAELTPTNYIHLSVKKRP